MVGWRIEWILLQYSQTYILEISQGKAEKWSSYRGGLFNWSVKSSGVVFRRVALLQDGYGMDFSVQSKDHTDGLNKCRSHLTGVFSRI